MAAWLAELKSRLLLPEPAGPEEPSSDEMAAALAFQLAPSGRDAAGRRAADGAAAARPRLLAARAAGDDSRSASDAVVSADLRDLLRAYGDHLRRRRARGTAAAERAARAGQRRGGARPHPPKSRAGARLGEPGPLPAGGHARGPARRRPRRRARRSPPPSARFSSWRARAIRRAAAEPARSGRST